MTIIELLELEFQQPIIKISLLMQELVHQLMIIILALMLTHGSMELDTEIRVVVAVIPMEL